MRATDCHLSVRLWKSNALSVPRKTNYRQTQDICIIRDYIYFSQLLFTAKGNKCDLGVYRRIPCSNVSHPRAECLRLFLLDEDAAGAVAGPRTTVPPLMSLNVEAGSSSTVFWASMWTIRSWSCHRVGEQNKGLGSSMHMKNNLEEREQKLCSL